MKRCGECENAVYCQARADEPDLHGCTSGVPREWINPPTHFLLCPVCGNKTRTKIKPDTRAKNLIVFCPKCKKESVMDIGVNPEGIYAELPAQTAKKEDMLLDYRRITKTVIKYD